MALDDYVESEVAIAVAATAAILSPKVRGVLRQGAVYGLAGVMVAGDAIGSFVSGVWRGVQQGAATAAGAAAAATGAATPEGTATTEKTPTTPEDAADALAAQAEGTETGEAATTGRRTRRTRAESAEGEG